VGCDSTTTLHLMVRYSNTGDTIASVCDSFNWYGTTYTASTNTPTHHSTNAMGCDSTTTLLLTVRYSTLGDTIASVCDYLNWYGTTYTASTNTPTHHSTNAAGCDSTTTLHLTVRYSTTGDTTANACDTFIWYNQTFTQSGNQAIHTFTNSANCDSTVTLHLTVRYSTASTYYDTVIENLLPRSFNGHSFTNDTANVLVTIPNAVGCDSNITYHLHVHHNVFVTVDSNLCNDILPITWNGVVFDTLVSQTDTMTRSVTFTAVTGADSTVQMNLYVHPLYDHHQYEEICDKQTFAFGDSVYASTGDYTDTLRSIHGCDSLSTLHLVVHDIYEQHYVDTICHDMTYEWRGHTVHSTADNLTEDFILHDSLYSIYGCDSVDILTLTKMALPRIAFTADTDCSISGYRLSVSATAPLSTGEEPRRMPYLHWTASPRDHSLLGQESYDTVGVSPRITTKYILYADYHKTPLCPATDSITLDQIIVPKAIIKVNPTTLSLDNLHFVAQDKTQSYHTHCYWYLDGMMYPGSGPIFEGDADPEADSVVIGLEVENGQCRDTAEMTLHINKVIVYVPNIFTPSKEDNNIFRIVTRGVTEGDLYIYDRVGNLVFHTNDLSQGWDGTHNGQPCQQRAYVWKLRFRTVDQPDGDQVKTGTVTLIR
ncbi:MAG: gliding motility-associated C-terminal domain-containing protein, partial [Bacteroidales bacterium]|nr:gliding motility-associated C-terminal domain-containing protein [Bacteroidales bacterium]